MDLLMEHMKNGIYLTLLLSLPMVLTAAGIGLIVGIVQAVTQVQEQTISTAPKILFVFLLIVFGGGVMMDMLGNYLRESFIIAFEEVPKMEKYVLPREPLRHNRFAAFEQSAAQAGSRMAHSVPPSKMLPATGFTQPPAMMAAIEENSPKHQVHTMKQGGSGPLPNLPKTTGR